MTDTAQCLSFSTRSNTKRAAEKMIANGKAPAVDYAIRPRDDGRFEIIWKATRAAPTTEVVEAVLTAATQTVTANSGLTDPTPTQTAIDPQLVNSAPASAEPQHDPFPAGTWVTVRQGRRKTSVGRVLQRINEERLRVHLLGKPEEWTILATAAQLACTEEPTPEARQLAEQSRRRKTVMPANRSHSQYAINLDLIAASKLPEKPPVVISKANLHYQKRFDTLHGYAAAGDWDAVRNYKVTGSNSYSKMVARYRQDLLALHAASEAPQ